MRPLIEPYGNLAGTLIISQLSNQYNPCTESVLQCCAAFLRSLIHPIWTPCEGTPPCSVESSRTLGWPNIPRAPSIQIVPTLRSKVYK